MQTDPMEIVTVEFNGDFGRELKGLDGDTVRSIGKGDRYEMKREQADADQFVTIVLPTVAPKSGAKSATVDAAIPGA